MNSEKIIRRIFQEKLNFGEKEIFYTPSVTPVLSLQILAIGLNVSIISGGGHWKIYRNHEKNARKKWK